MKSILFTNYGSPDDLQFGEVERPVPRKGEVLVKVRATSVNSWDLDLLRGIPFANRAMFGLFKPKTGKLGIDIAGTVEQVGKDVTRFKPGDEVFGDLSDCGMGAYAEYAVASDKALTKKPEGMSYEQAAATPHTGLLAMQGLVEKGKVREGSRVLINGAGGGSGTFGVQIARSFGAEVTCVDSPEKFDMLRSIGADRVIDYRTEDFVESGQEYDIILDVVTYRSIFDYKRVLAGNGKYVMLGGGNYNRVFQTFMLGPLISLTGSRKMGVLMHEPNRGMGSFLELFESGKVTPVIDRTFPLPETADALRYFEEGLAQGKIVITMNRE
jgi:NADPH:quinone reductase-like Zn-dependent oxidoreductase